MAELVFPFDAELPSEGARELLGGKGAGLAAMTRIGIPVPPGFTITTEVCRAFLERDEHDGSAARPRGASLPDDVRAAVREALAGVERATGRTFGGETAPLLVSVRSGAAASMPGMMDTVLNLGLTTKTLPGLAAASGDERFALDAYRRLVQMFGEVVLGVPAARFESALARRKSSLGRPRMLDAELDAAALEALVADFRAIVLEVSGTSVPDHPEEQLFSAIEAVFRSWNNTRAKRYRRMQGIPAHLGTACTVQAMVFGNRGPTSGSGVAFTRNPSTGEKRLYGEYLANAQGEDVVSGIRTPASLTAGPSIAGRPDASLERTMPEVFAEIARHCDTLERHFRDLQEVEFTIEEGRPYVLQTRSGKRAAQAGVRIAVDMVNEGLRTREEALLLLDPGSLEQLMKAKLPTAEALAAQGVEPLAQGLPASPGAATGTIVFEADDAVRAAAEGREVILVRRETSPEDVHGMRAAAGILTAAGGMTSHAAVVARGLGKTCVAGCSSVAVDPQARTMTVRVQGPAGATTRRFVEGDELTLDGSSGHVYAGAIAAVPAAALPELATVLEWADAARRLEVRANADSPRAARLAARLGSRGIGLCRTEPSFFAPASLLEARALLLAGSDAEAERHARALAESQRPDLRDLFRELPGQPCAVRLFDWPVHELLPKDDGEIERLASDLRKDAGSVRRRIRAMSEKNPILGNRGARVGLTYPRLYRAQVRAILGAALDAAAEGLDPRPELLVPIVSAAEELAALRPILAAEAEALFAEAGARVDYRVGVILELPRACLVADDLAKHADFFTFGTNDLTQTTFGISQSDAASFLSTYVQDLGVFAADPFARLDRRGVGTLIRLAVEGGRRTRSDLGLGMCGDHGGEPDSIDFCEELGMDHVSCAPSRIPIARVAAAQAALRRRPYRA